VRPLDRRLLDEAPSTRAYLVFSVVVGSVTAILVISQAWLLADIVNGAFGEEKDLAQLTVPMAVLLGVVVLKGVAGWISEVVAGRTSARAKSQLRAALVRRAAADAAPGATTSGEVATLATRGIDAMDAYFSRYLPQLVLAVIVPICVLAAMATSDIVAAAIVAVTLPLIPVFMWLIGATTRDKTNRQLRTLQRLSGHFLDVVAGLPTLKVFGRAKAQAATIKEVSERYRQTAMASLRITFLSSLVLELLSTISVALVAVAVGLRLMGGRLDLQTALFVLVLAPEAYLPLRLLGANYHASSEGRSAAEQVFDVVDRSAPERGSGTDVPDPASTPLVIDGLTVSYPGRPEPVIDGLSLTVHPGEILAVTGPSGCGKSTLLAVLLGFIIPDGGSVQIGSTDLATLDPDAWRERVAWVPQRPHLFSGSIADNVRLGRPGATDAQVQAALAAADLGTVVDGRRRDAATTLGERGAGLSAGERQRVALARAFLRGAPLLVLDEPTANLDGGTEERVVESIRRAAVGRTVVMVAHRPALVAMADRVLELTATAVPS